MEMAFPASDPIGTGPRTERAIVETNDSSLYSVCWIRNSGSASLSIISLGWENGGGEKEGRKTSERMPLVG